MNNGAAAQRTPEMKMAVQSVAYGEIQSMITEVSAQDMGEEFIKRWGIKYCVMAIGDEQYDTEYFQTIAGAREDAKHLAKIYGVDAWRV